MNRHILIGLLAVTLVCGGFSGGASAAMSKGEKQKARAEVQSMEKDVLEQLYKTQPSAKTAISKAAGYAVFSNFGLKLFLVGGGKGEGIAVNNTTKKKTYMKMLELQAGLGLGVKKFRLVWVFETQRGFDSFVKSGWEFGGHTTAAAKNREKGAAFEGALSVSAGVWVYQLTDTGLALELAAKGTKYYKDDELN